MSETKTYIAIDIAKLFCALLIVYIHTYCFEPGGAWIKTIVCPMAVPFFFITSGFFLEKGLNNSSDQKIYIRKYFFRILTMYCIWTIMTLPISWMTITIAHGDYSWWLKCIYLIREFFFSGSLGIYWYLLCLLYGCIMIYWANRLRCLNIAILLATSLFIIGVILNTGIGWNTTYGKMTHIIFGSTRNPFNEGFFYMLLGFLISKHSLQWNKTYSVFGFILSIIAAYICWKYTKIQTTQLFSALCLFMWMKDLNLESHIGTSTAYKCRKLSTTIYLLQFPFILLFDFYLKRGTLIDFSITVLFCVLAFAGSSIVLPKKWFNMIYG